MARQLARPRSALALNVLSLLLLIVLAIAIVVAYRVGAARASRDRTFTAVPAPSNAIEPAIDTSPALCHSAEDWAARALSEDRYRLFRAIADARDETARYRQLLIDLES